MHTVLDTNILISALLFRGQLSLIHNMIVLGRITAFYSPSIIREYAKVLAYPKFGLTEKEIQYLLEDEIGRYFHPVSEPIGFSQWIPKDPSDDCFINTALACPGAILVSRDRHILEARKQLPVEVFSGGELLQELLG